MPENKGGIPEKIKLGDKEFVVKDHPELLDLLQKARKEEKDKLYSQISSFEAKIKVLEDEKKTNGELSVAKEEKLKALQDELAVAKAEKEKLEKTKGGGKGKPDPEEEEEDDDDPKGKKSKSKPTANGISKEEMEEILRVALEGQQKVFDKKIEEVKGGLTKKTVGDYRKEQLEKHKGLIIEDLVREDLDSEEAVNKAIEQALEKSKPYIQKEYEVDGKKQRMTIAEYEEYEKSQKGKGGDEGKGTGNYTPPTPPDKPDGGSGNLTGKELLSRIEEMSDEEYAKHADQILKEVKSVKYQDS